MSTNWQSWPLPDLLAAFTPYKGSKLKLSLETRSCGDIVVIYCEGRIVYRDEAAALSRMASEVFEHSNKLVLDFSGVSSMDSAGVGELAFVCNLAREKNATLKCAGANAVVRNLLELTRLDSVLEIHGTADEAVDSYEVAPSESTQMWAEC